MGLEQVYTEILTEHNQSKHNKHPLPEATMAQKGVNASCGDEISLEIKEKDGIIEDAAFTGVGCAISQASTSIMIDLIKGKTLEEAMELAHTFYRMIKNEIEDEEELEALDEAVALQGISHMPARVKCAVLCWKTLEVAVEAKQKREANKQ